jgi:hypothetical protein
MTINYITYVHEVNHLLQLQMQQNAYQHISNYRLNNYTVHTTTNFTNYSYRILKFNKGDNFSRLMRTRDTLVSATET